MTIQSVSIRVEVSTDINDIRRKALTLAQDMRKHLPTTVKWATCLRRAWRHVLRNPDTTHMIFWKKVDGSFARRVVNLDPTGHMTFKGTGKPLKPGQRLFVDLAKVKAKEWYEFRGEQFKRSTIISAYQDNIFTIF